MRFLVLIAVMMGVLLEARADVKVTDPEQATSPLVPAPVESAEASAAVMPSAPLDKEPQVVSSLETLALDPKVKISKVHVVDNTGKQATGGNKALEFERKYWNYGAILASEKEARRGQIYVVSFAKGGPAENVKARLQYRQVGTKDQVREQIVEFNNVQGTQRATFNIVGDEFREAGPVYSWRFTVLRGTQVIAQETSYIW
jgi:hypothetical protein